MLLFAPVAMSAELLASDMAATPVEAIFFTASFSVTFRLMGCSDTVEPALIVTLVLANCREPSGRASASLR